MSGTILLFVLIVAGVLAAMLFAVANSRRRREQIDQLMVRVEDLEQRLSAEVGERPQSEAIEIDSGTDEPGSPGLPDLSADVLAGWTTHIGRMLTEEGGPRDLADQAVIKIHHQIGFPIQPSGLASDLNISLRTLERFLSRSLKCSPGQLILAVKMREARRMLESGQFRVGEVAHHLAFSDAAHFSRRYRRFYHCPPSRHLAR